MQRYFLRIARQDRQDGYETVKGGLYGFVGKKTRHALLGDKEDRSLLQVSGASAQNALVLCRNGDNCTRLDVQITLRVGQENVNWFLAQQERRLLAHPARHGKRPDVDARHKNGKVETVYSGSRKSDVFVRLYDKFAESRKEEHRGCVRFEVVFKGDASKALWAHLAEGDDGIMYLLRLLLHVLEQRGVDTSAIELQRQDIAIPRRQNTKENVTLGWWASQVAPSVARISAERGWQWCFHVLFGKACTEWDRTAIMNSFSIAWGN